MESASEGPDPRRIASPADLVAALDHLRRLGARGTGKAKLSIDDVARRSGLPRSTTHAYLSGRLIPPADALDAIVIALGVPPRQLRGWGDALLRLPASGRSETPVAGAPAAPASPQPTALPLPAPQTRGLRLLPPAPRGFAGRDEELREITSLATPGEVIALVGPGGAGKTALALTWATQHAGDFADGIVHVDLRGFSTAELVEPATALPQLLAVTGEPVRGEEPALLAAWRAAMAMRRVLVILDNALDAAHVRPLLPGGQATTIVTSRDSLRSLVVRDGARRVVVDGLDPSTGARLLRTLSAAEITDADAADLAGCCAGLPLALRIMADQLTTTPADELLARVRSSSTALLDGLRLQESGTDIGVRGVLRSTYDALSELAKTLFRATGELPGPTVLPALLRRLTGLDEGLIRQGLDELVARHLLTREGDTCARHDLVDAFARELAADVPPQRALRAVCEVARQCGRALGIPSQLEPPTVEGADDLDHDEALPLIRAILPVAAGVARRCLGAGLEADARHETHWLLEMLARLADEVAQPGAAVSVLRTAVDVVDDPEVEAILLLRLSALLGGLGRLDESAQRLLRCVGLAEAHGLSHLEAGALSNLGWLYARQGRFSECNDALERSLELAREANDERRLLLAHQHMANNLLEQGRDEEAVAAMDAAQPLLERRGSAESRVLMVLNRAEVAIRAGDLEQARARHRQAVALAEEGMPGLSAAVDIVAGELARRDGEIPAVRAACARALTAAPDDAYVELRAAHLEAWALRREGRGFEAAALLRKAMRTAQDGGQLLEAVRAQVALAEVLSDFDPAAARAQADEAADEADRMGLVGELPARLAALAEQA